MLAAPARAVRDPVDEFLAGPRAWPLLRMAYSQNIVLTLREVDGAPPGRFFPGTTAFALERLTAEGHFLELRCAARECGRERDILQERALLITLLRSLPRDGEESELFDPETWALTDKGMTTVQKVRRRFPDLPQRLAGLLARAVPRRKG